MEAFESFHVVQRECRAWAARRPLCRSAAGVGLTNSSQPA